MLLGPSIGARTVNGTAVNIVIPRNTVREKRKWNPHSPGGLWRCNPALPSRYLWGRTSVRTLSSPSSDCHPDRSGGICFTPRRGTIHRASLRFHFLLRNSWLLGGRGLDDLESELGGFPLELLDL